MTSLVFFVLSLLLLLLSQVNFSSSFSNSSSSLSSSPSCFALFQFSQSFSIINYNEFMCDEYYHIASYPKTASWKEGTDCCAWDGVQCDSVTGHVISIDLTCSWLYGNFHSNSTLFQLHHLKSLNLAFNYFNNSPIPSEFGKLKTLTHLNLSSSYFLGRVPYEISQLSSLLSLDLTASFSVATSLNVELEAPVWRGLIGNLTKLRKLSLEGVNMSSIRPSSLMNLSSSLASLDLFACDMRGELKDNILRLPNMQTLNLGWNGNLKVYFPRSNWSSSLRSLDLSGLTFSRELPDSIGTLKSLESLTLCECDLLGSIPIALGNLTQMTLLDLYRNKLTGSIPAALGNLTQMTFLRLSNNNLSGSIPAALGNLTQMTDLELSNNNLTGLLPSSVFNLTQLQVLELSSNQLIGPLPSHVNGFPNLTYLFLSGNFLNGTLPSWLFTLPSLVNLGLDGNKLTGHMDEFQYDQLEVIDLSNNKLHGSIPRSIARLVNLQYIALSSNNFSGELEFDFFSKFTNLATLNISYNSLSLSINKNVTYTFPKLERLELSSCNISEFPNFSNITNLQYLDLSNNRIHGHVPRWLCDHESVPFYYHLNLSHNFLTSIKQLPHAFIVDLHSNLLEGPLPALHSNVLLISNNKLTGEIPLSTCNASSLQILDLSYNNLSGKIPQCLGNFSNYLSVLNLRMNSFHGSIPTTFAKGQILRNLDLNGNKLEGSLPRSLVTCRTLEVLDIGNNKLNDTFPHWLGSLPELRVLILRSNRFHGSIENPKTKFSFPKLRILDLSHNEFTGLLPRKYFKNLKAMIDVNENQVGLNYMGDGYYQDSVMVTMKGLEIELVKIQTFFTTIDFSNNSFRGEMPQLIGKLKSLKGLNFSHNNLTGYIPLSLGNLSNLEWLDLSSNKLVGEIPRQLADLTSLAVLNLSQNQLVGPIPTGNQFNTFSNDSYSGNLGLCGFPLSKMCGNHEAQQPPPPSTLHVEDDSFGNGFTWKVVLLGYGCGVVFGMFLAYLVFKTGKPEWLVRMIELEQHIMLRKLKKNARKRGGRRN